MILLLNEKLFVAYVWLRVALTLPLMVTVALPGMPVFFEMVTWEVLTDVKVKEISLISAPS